MKNMTFTLACSFTDEVQKFDDASAAGRAFAQAKGPDAPSVIQSDGKSARTIARTVNINGQRQKSVPKIENTGADRTFWAAYREEVGLLAVA